MDIVTYVIMYRSFKHFVEEYFPRDLYHLLESFNSDVSDDVNTCFKKVVDCLNDIVNFHAPLKARTIRKNNVPYMNSEWRKIMYKKNMMRNIKNKILVLKIMNSTDSLTINVSKSQKGKKKTMFHWAMRRWSKNSAFLGFHQTIH